MYLTLFVLASLWTAATSAVADVLTREAAVAVVLDDHPEVLASKAAWSVARGRHLQNSILSDPELEIEFEELPGVLDTGQFGERNVSVTQMIENPVKWFYRNKSSGYNVESVRLAGYEMTRLRMAARAKIAFDRVLADEMILASTTENFELSRSLSHRARIRFDAGDIPKLELLRALVEEARAQNRRTEAKGRMIGSRQGLNVLMGRSGGSDLELSGNLSTEAFVISPDMLRQETTSRPDVRGAEQSLAANRAARSATLASWVPDLNLGIGRQTIDSTVGRSSFWRASLGFSLPLWAPFRQRGEWIAASANRALAEAELASVTRSAGLEVDEAFLAYQTGQEQVRLFEDRILKLAEETYRVAQESYSHGKASYLDLLGAQKTLMASRIEHVEALLAFRTAIAELELAVGANLTLPEVIKQ